MVGVGDGDLYWAVATTHPQCERKALENLSRQDFSCYAPKTRELRVKNGKKHWVERWLFPRYLFVWIVDKWSAVCSTIGVRGVILDGDKPARLPASFVDDLKNSERNGFIVLPKTKRKAGQRVQIERGVFTGQFGIYQGMSSREREIVLLDCIGRVELAAGDLG